MSFETEEFEDIDLIEEATSADLIEEMRRAMKQRGILAILAIALATTAAHAGYVEVALNPDTADLRGGFHFGKSVDSQVFLGGRYLYHDFDEGGEIDDAGIPAIVAGFSSRPVNNNEVAFMIGGQIYFGQAADEEVEGLALGTAVAWNPGGWKGFYLGGRVWWCPSAFSFGDTDGIFEWGVQGGYAFNSMFRVFAEYMSFEFDVEDIDDIEVVDEVLVGFNYNF